MMIFQTCIIDKFERVIKKNPPKAQLEIHNNLKQLCVLLHETTNSKNIILEFEHSCALLEKFSLERWPGI